MHKLRGTFLHHLAPSVRENFEPSFLRKKKTRICIITAFVEKYVIRFDVPAPRSKERERELERGREREQWRGCKYINMYGAPHITIANMR